MAGSDPPLARPARRRSFGLTRGAIDARCSSLRGGHPIDAASASLPDGVWYSDVLIMAIRTWHSRERRDAFGGSEEAVIALQPCSSSSIARQESRAPRVVLSAGRVGTTSPILYQSDIWAQRGRAWLMPQITSGCLVAKKKKGGLAVHCATASYPL